MKSIMMILFIIISASLTAQTLDDIVGKHLEAVGHENLLKKNTLISKGKIIQGENEFPFTAYSKRPNKFRMDSSIMEYTFTQAYDGKTGWVLNPLMGINKPTKLHPGEEENLKFQSEFDGYIYNHENKEYTLEYAGTEEVFGMDTHLLHLIKASGDSISIFIDAENFLILKTRSKAGVGGEFRFLENIFSNYQNIDGILSPFDVETQVEGMTLSQLIYESYDYSSDVTDSVFTFTGEETTPLQETEPDSSK